MNVVVQIIVAFYRATGPWSQDFCHRVTKVNCLSNTFRKFYGRHTDLVRQYFSFYINEDIKRLFNSLTANYVLGFKLITDITYSEFS